MEKIHAELVGVGGLLKQARFSVPPHQRPYAWQQEQVTDLYRDLNDAHKRKNEEYFLGTTVLASGSEGRQVIIDGQQRLVTVSILIGAIRDYFIQIGQSGRAEDIERDYLSKRDIRTQEATPHLYLTPEDRDFFVKRVIRPVGHPDRATPAASQAQQRLADAIDTAAKFVANLSATTQKPDDALLDLLEYVDEKALLIKVAVGDEANAYVIFEVLNDRGLDLSVADLLKNYVFRLAGTRLEEAQAAWKAMATTITDVAEEPDIKSFIRQAWIARNGLTREKALYDAIKRQVTTQGKAIDFARELAAAATIYAALRNPSHDRWKVYGDNVIESLEVLDMAGVTQIRPLLLAVFNKFSADEIKKALPMAVAWTVRFLICGSGGSGTLEAHYSERAKEVSAGKISTAQDLYEAMKAVVPSDQQFEDVFATTTVSKVGLAKYYLRVLDGQQVVGEQELVINPDSEKVNLEHVLPQTASAAWAHIPTDQFGGLVKRIGNLTLMGKRLNSKAANSGFADKKKLFAESKIGMTKALSDLPEWTPATIDTRQREMAKIAVKAWPAKPRG